MFLGFIFGVIAGMVLGVILMLAFTPKKYKGVDRRLIEYEMEERRRKAEEAERIQRQRAGQRYER